MVSSSGIYAMLVGNNLPELWAKEGDLKRDSRTSTNPFQYTIETYLGSDLVAALAGLKMYNFSHFDLL